MKQTLEDYCREVEEKAEKFVQAEEMHERAGHLQAFNLGRIVQRTENSRRNTWLRVCWLLVGVTIGVTFGRSFPDYLTSALAHHLFTKASLAFREFGRTGLYNFWKNLRV